MFSSYIEDPQNCSFEGQDAEEKILLLLRAHPITNLTWISLAILLFFAPAFILRLMPILGFDLTYMPDTYLIVFLIINYLLVLVVTFEGFLYWYFNATLITNHKVVDIDFEPVLYKGVDLAPLTKIEEVDSTTSGIIGTAFNFGDVAVQTAGAKVAIELKNIPKPAKVADLILDLARVPHEHLGESKGT